MQTNSTAANLARGSGVSMACQRLSPIKLKVGALLTPTLRLPSAAFLREKARLLGPQAGAEAHLEEGASWRPVSCNCGQHPSLKGTFWSALAMLFYLHAVNPVRTFHH